MKYGIRITIQRDSSSETRSLWHWENEDNYPLLLNSKEDAEAYLGVGEEDFGQKIPIYCREGEFQTMEVMEFYE